MEFSRGKILEGCHIYMSYDNKLFQHYFPNIKYLHNIFPNRSIIIIGPQLLVNNDL